MSRPPKVTASVSPLGRLNAQSVTIRYRDSAGAEQTLGLNSGTGWAGEVLRIAAHGGETIEVKGHRGKRSWRLWPERSEK